MRKLVNFISVFASILLFTNVSAQESAPTYLLQDSTKLGAYIGPGYQMTAIGGQYSGQFTIKGGFMLDNRFAIGVHVSEMMNEMNPQEIPDDLTVEQLSEVDIAYNEAGLDFFYSPRASETIHLIYGISATWGKVQATGENSNLGESSVASVIPQVNLGVNLLPWLKFQAGFGYRIASELSGLNDYGLGSRSMNAPNAQFGIFLGRY